MPRGLNWGRELVTKDLWDCEKEIKVIKIPIMVSSIPLGNLYACGCVFVCLYAYTYVCMCVDFKGQSFVSSLLSWCPPCLGKDRVSHWICKLANSEPQGYTPVFTSTILGLQATSGTMSSVWYRCKGLNSGPHAHTAGTLPTEPSPWRHWIKFLISQNNFKSLFLVPKMTAALDISSLLYI